MGALELQPVARAGGEIWTGRALGDDALPPAAACRAKCGLAIATAIRRVAKVAVEGQGFPEPGLALEQGKRTHVFTAKLEQAGYVEVLKTFRGRVPHTELCLTPAGRSAFESRLHFAELYTLQLPSGFCDARSVSYSMQ